MFRVSYLAWHRYCWIGIVDAIVVGLLVSSWLVSSWQIREPVDYAVYCTVAFSY